MRLYTPHPSDSTSLQAQLHAYPDWLVICFCAEWCGTCKEYRLKLETLAASLPTHTFVWADIEDYPELVGDEDIENFPSLYIEHQQQAVFFGTLLPHIEHLQRLLNTLSANTNKPVITALAPIREVLLGS